MKDRVWSLLIVILLNGCLASDCIGDVDYVDAVTWGCTNITGHLNVQYVSGLIDLSELSALNFVGGGLSIYGNPDLVSVNLEGLIWVGGHITINENDVLLMIDGFEALEEVGGYFLIANHPMLNEVSGFASLTSVEGFFSIVANDRLLRIDGFDALTYVGVYFSVFSNVNLTLFDAFDNLVTVVTDFTIHENTALIEISHFSKLETVGGYFSINRCSFVQLNGFESLTSIGANFNFYENDELLEINAFGSLSSIGSYFTIRDCASLSQLSALENLTYVGGYFTITNNNAWTELNNFPVLETIDSFLTISGNSFTGISGFESLISVGNSLNVHDNSYLTVINAFESLQDVGTDLNIYSNNAALMVNGLGNLDYIGGSITLQTLTHCAIQIVDAFNRLDYSLSGCSDFYCLESSFGSSCLPCACEYPSLMTCDEGISGSGNCTCIEEYCGFVETSIYAEDSTGMQIQTTVISDTTIPVKTTETQIQNTVVETTMDNCPGPRSCVIEYKPVLITGSEILENVIFIFKNNTVVSGGRLEISNSEIKFNNLDLHQATLVLGSSVVSVENSMKISSSTMIVHLTSEEHESITHNNLLLISTGNTVIGKFDKVMVYIDDNEVGDVETVYTDGIYLAQKKNDFSSVLITIIIVVAVLGLSVVTVYYFKDILIFHEDESPHFPDKGSLELE